MTQITISVEDIPVNVANLTAKIITFQGQLDETNVDEKSKMIYEIIEKNPQNLRLLMNFENLEYMNSKSIGYLTDWYGKVSEGGGKIVVAQARPNILDILEVVGLTQLISCYSQTPDPKQGLDEAKLALLA